MELAEIYRRACRNFPKGKEELDGDPEKTTENLLQSRRLIKIVDLENKMEVPTLWGTVSKGKICLQTLLFYSVSPYYT